MVRSERFIIEVWRVEALVAANPSEVEREVGPVATLGPLIDLGNRLE